MANCGQRAIARACGVPFDDVEAKFGHKDRTYLFVDELEDALRAYAAEWWKLRAGDTVMMFLEYHPVGRFILALEGHAISVINKKVEGGYTPHQKIHAAYEVKKREATTS